MEEREKKMKNGRNAKIQELQEVNSSYEKAIVQECKQLMHIVARTKSLEIKEKRQSSDAATRYKNPLWEIDSDYSL